MAHFAKVINGIVTDVIVCEQDFLESIPDYNPNEWVQTSYNTRGGIHYLPDSNTPSEDQSKALRKNYAGIGFSYDVQRDAFIPPKPYDSWLLNEETCLWEPLVPYPTDTEKLYEWNEELVAWVEITNV